MKDLSVITVTHESKDFIVDQLLSVSIGTFGVSFEQIVVDNASRDGTAELVERGFGVGVRVMKNAQNVGFARANQQGLELATGRYVLFLNPDMCVEVGALDRLVPWMDAHPEVGLAGCQLLDADGYAHAALTPRRIPTFWQLVCFFLHLEALFPALRLRWQYAGFDPEVEREVDSVRGAFMLVRREVIERLGRGFDPGYFLLFEDLDFCREVKGLGYRVVYTPQSVCKDFFHRSFLHHSRLWKYVQMGRSLVYYTAKWHGRVQAIFIGLAYGLGWLIRLPLWCLRWRDAFCKRV